MTSSGDLIRELQKFVNLFHRRRHDGHPLLPLVLVEELVHLLKRPFKHNILGLRLRSQLSLSSAAPSNL